MARRAGRSAPALRGSRGPSPRARGPSPGGGPPLGGAPPGPPPPPEPPAPPTEKDIQRRKLRDIMDRKVVVWDRMFETEKDEDRRRGLERFKKLSEEEMALATRNLSKSKLKEFIDLKIHYFDQLANARNEDKRLEGLRRFKKVGDDEYFLARTVGPDDNLDEIVKRRNEQDKEDQAKAEIEKAQRDMEEKKQQQIKEMEKLQQQQMEQMQQAQLDQMKQQLLQQQQQMQDQLYASMSDPLMAQMMDMSGVPGMTGMSGLAGMTGAGHPMASEWAANLALGFPSPLNPEDIYAQAQQALLEQQLAAQSPFMPPPPQPKPTPQQPQYATGALPPLFFPTPHLHDPQLFSPRARRHPLASRLQGMTAPRGATGMDIGNKMRLLTQLEATRQALQSQPVGSRSSMADEIKENLRKLNNLKMRLIEDIMGGDRGGGRGGSIDFPVERGRRSPQRVEKSTKDRKIIVEFVGPGVDPALAAEVGAAGGEGPKDTKDRKEPPSVAFVDVTAASGGRTCPMHQCRAHQQCIEMDFIPPVPDPMPGGAEPLPSPPTSQGVSPQPLPYPPYPIPQDQYAQYQPRSGLYPSYMDDSLAQYPQPFDPYLAYAQPPLSSDASRPEVIWERQDLKSFAEKSTMVDPPEALKYLEAAVTNDGQQVVKEVYKRFLLEEAIPRPASPQTAKPPAPQQVFVPIPMSMVDQGTSFGDPRVRSMHEIGISVMPIQGEQQDSLPGEPRVIETRKGPLISKTTIVVNRPEPPEPTQIILPPPPPPPKPPPPPPPPQPPPAPAAAPASLPASTTSEQTTPPRSPRIKEGATLPLRASMERLVNSIDDMFDSLSTRRARSKSRARPRAVSRARSRRRRRSSSQSFSDDDDYDDYDSRRSPRYSRRRRRREFEGDFDDEDDKWDNNGFDYDTTYYRSRDRGESRSRKTRSRDRSREKSREPRSPDGTRRSPDGTRRSPDELPSLWGWLCRSLCNITDMPQDRITTRTDPRDVRVLQMGSRIRTLIQNVIRVSQEVIEARRAIQQSGLKGEDYVKNIFAAESKLWELIDLEAQLANELAMYRTSDFATDDQYFQGLAKAEDKIRRLIGVETQLAREIGNWRRANLKGAQPSRSTIYTTLSRLPSVTFSRLLPIPGSRRSPTPPTLPTASYTTSTTTTGSTASGMSGATGTTSTSTSPTASGGATPVGSAAQTPSGSSSPTSTATTTTTTGTTSTQKSKKSKSKSGSKKKKKKKKKKKRSKSRSSKKKKRKKKKKKSRSKSRSKRKKKKKTKKKKRKSKSRSSRRRRKKRRKRRKKKKS